MLATWNVRGMNTADKQRNISHFVHKHKLGFVELLETKLHSHKISTCYNKLFPTWRSINNSDQHPRGRIWILWQESEFEVNALMSDAHFIQLELVCKSTQGRFALTVVYAPNELAERYALWDRLCTLSRSVLGPWLVMGDFNNVLTVEERIGGLQPNVELMPFKECLSECGLEDMHSSARVFTWNNGTIWSKIDRALINEAWIRDFSGVEAYFAPENVSDHSPILINFDVRRS